MNKRGSRTFTNLAGASLAILAIYVVAPAGAPVSTPAPADTGLVWPTGNTPSGAGAVGETSKSGPLDDPPLFECPPGSMFSQLPFTVSPLGYLFRNSDLGAGYLVYDNFEVSNEIRGITFWGFDLYFDGQWSECVEDPMTFEVKFYHDAGGLPGDPACSYTVTPVRIETGHGYEWSGGTWWLNEYTAELDPPCTLPSGWVSVQGVSITPPDNCWFTWVSSPEGDGTSLQQPPTPPGLVLYDRGLCLVGPTGACCFPDHSCQELGAEECASAGGDYQGDDTSCDPNPCLPPGDVCDDPLPVPGLPFNHTGDLCYFTDSYDETCPDPSPGSPEVVYLYEPVDDVCAVITLCAGMTNYDSKLYVYENVCPDPGSPFACNDDACTSAAGHDNVSRLCLNLTGGNSYYIVVDGHGGDCGFYELDIFEDTTPPTFAEAPGQLDLTIECDESTDPANTGTPTPLDNCTPGLTYDDSVVAGSCPQEWTITRTWTATDACGYTAEYVQTITVVDGTPPTATQGTIDACYASAAEAEAAALAATTNLADNCSDPANLIVAAGTEGTCDATVTVTVTDECDNTGSFNYSTRIDNEPPTVTAGTIGHCYGTSAEAEQAAIDATSATDNCTATGDLLFSAYTSRNCDATITVTVTDECGNADQVTYGTWIDPEPPLINGCPGDIQLEAEPGRCDAVVTWAPITAWDNCGVADFVHTHSSGDTFPVGTTTVTYTATDACGNQTVCNFDVTVIDAEEPVIHDCPPSMTVDNDPGLCAAVVTWMEPSASDNCGVTSFVSTHDPGDTFPVGTTTVTYTAEDAVGHTATCSFDVTVNDAEEPVITVCADPVTLYVDVNEQAYVPDLTGDVTASDNCDLDPTITQDPPAGRMIGFGTHTVEIAVTDDAGLASTCYTTITVLSIGTPRLILEVDETCYLAGSTVTVRIWMLSIAETIVGGDFCLAYDDTKLQLVSVDPGESPFTREIYECSEVAGGSQPQCDPAPGVIDYAVGIPEGEMGVAGDGKMAVLTFTALEDICTAQDLVSWRSHYPPTRLSADPPAPVYPELFARDVVDDAPPTVSRLTITGGAVDDNCLATVSFEATVTDDCCLDPDYIAVNLTLIAGNAELGTPTINKVLLPDSRTVQIDGSIDVFNLTNGPATVQVAVLAEDCCGNAAEEALAIANVDDLTPPTIDDLTAAGGDADGNCEQTVTFSATVNDNCCVDPDQVVVDVALTTGTATLGTPSIVKTPLGPNTVQVDGSVLVSELESCLATVQVTVLADDCRGNVAGQATATADVQDGTPPTVTDCPADVQVVAEFAQFSVEVTWSAPAVQDNCDPGPTVVYEIDLDSDGSVDDTIETTTYTFPLGTHTVTVVATDACGNFNDTCRFTVTVEPLTVELVQLEWRLTSPAVCPERDFEVGLYAVSTDAQLDVPMARIDVVLSWNPTHVQLLGVDNNGPYAWQSSDFPDDSGQDGLNDTWDDGDALYRALAQTGDPALATPGGLLVTTFQFTALTGGTITQIAMLESAGSYSATRVLTPEMPDLNVLASLDTLDVEPNVPGDMDCNGVLDAFDIDPFVLALIDPAAYAAAYPNCNVNNADVNCNGAIDAFDIDPFVVLLTGG